MIAIARSTSLYQVDLVSVCSHAPDCQSVSLSAHRTAKVNEDDYQTDSISIELTVKHIPKIRELLRELKKLEKGCLAQPK